MRTFWGVKININIVIEVIVIVIEVIVYFYSESLFIGSCRADATHKPIKNHVIAAMMKISVREKRKAGDYCL